jgi:hypothetical protein
MLRFATVDEVLGDRPELARDPSWALAGVVRSHR